MFKLYTRLTLYSQSTKGNVCFNFTLYSVTAHQRQHTSTPAHQPETAHQHTSSTPAAHQKQHHKSSIPFWDYAIVAYLLTLLVCVLLHTKLFSYALSSLFEAMGGGEKKYCSPPQDQRSKFHSNRVFARGGMPRHECRF